jgi:hypothetical protein
MTGPQGPPGGSTSPRGTYPAPRTDGASAGASTVSQPPGLDLARAGGVIGSASSETRTTEESLTSPDRSADAGLHDDEQPLEVLPRLVRFVGTVVAPTTLLTGLLFYFGRLHVTGFFRYFRVNFTVLDLTVNDYLIRSADGLFRPLGFITVIGLLALWLNRALVERLDGPSRRKVTRALMPALVVLGGFLLALSVVDLLDDGPLLAAVPEAGGLGLSCGVLLVAYAAHLSRTTSGRSVAPQRRLLETTVLAEWGLVFLLLSIGLFWAVGSYAINVGTGRAQQTEEQLLQEADAVLYSERSLRLAVAGVAEVRCLDPDAAYRFRYDGLKLVLQSGDQYLLLPAGWTRENGTALLIPRSEAVRLEFAPPGQQRQPVC